MMMLIWIAFLDNF